MLQPGQVREVLLVMDWPAELCTNCGAPLPKNWAHYLCKKCYKMLKTKHLSGRVPIALIEDIEFLISQKKYKNKTDFLLTAVRELLRKEQRKEESAETEEQEPPEATEARIRRVVDDVLFEKFAGVSTIDV